MSMLRKHHEYRLQNCKYLAVHSPHCDDPDCHCSGWYLLRGRARRLYERTGEIDEDRALSVEVDGEIGKPDTSIGLWMGLGLTIDDLAEIGG
jgi:hypothetical protein